MVNDTLTGAKLADDLIRGASAIARFMYGDDGPTALRRVYYLTSEVPPEQRLPFFRLGQRTIAIRKSTLLAYITRLENQNAA